MSLGTSNSFVAVGGGHSVKPHEPYYQEAVALGRWLAERGIGVRSGGYGGIMEAISKGVTLGNGHVAGVGLANWPAEGRNEFVPIGDYSESSSICRRAEDIFWGADAMVFFSGGVGTLAELCAVWAGKIMGSIPATTPLILVGKEWNRLLTAMSDNLRVFQAHKQHLRIFGSVEELINDDPFSKPANHAASENDRARWDAAAEQWDRDLKSTHHYSNLEKSYERFDRFLVRTLDNRVWGRTPLQLLDLGCATGTTSQSLFRNKPEAASWLIDGLDFAPAMVRQAEAKRIYRKVYCFDAEHVSRLNEQYHVIFSRGVLLSRFTTQQLRSVFADLKNRLLDGGLFVFDFLNSIVDDPLATGGKTRLLFSEIGTILRESGFRITDVEGLGCRTYTIACIKQTHEKSPIKLVTSNSAKYRGLAAVLEQCGVTMLQLDREIREIQSKDLGVVSCVKAQQLFESLQTPLMVDDAALFLDALPGFPGTMTKQVLQTIGLDGLQALLRGKSTAASLRCVISVACDGSTIKQFAGELKGTLDFNQVRGSALPLNAVFVPHGQTLSLEQLERAEPNFPTHRLQAVNAACEWIKNERVSK